MKCIRKTLTAEAKDDMRIFLSMQPQKLSTEPVCDFCGDPRPVFVYAAKRMSTGEERRCWRWCACRRCTILVDSESWAELSLRVVKMLSRFLPLEHELLHKAVDLCVNSFKRDVLTEEDVDKDDVGKGDGL